MDVETLARVQFALTIMFHYIYPPLSIGLGLLMVFYEAIYLKTGKKLYLEITKYWTRIFALTFAIGVATGIVMEFEFGTNWATYSRFVGDVFGSALAAEGVFAFFLESGFLALLLFGWNRISKGLHFFATVMVCLGAHFSAVWIVVANSWMQTPAGFVIEGEGLKARAVITDFWEMVFNPSSADRLIHSILGCWLAGAFLVISISCYYLLKKRHQEFANASLRVALPFALITCILMAISGDSNAKMVAAHQPMKLAALEGRFKTERNAPLAIFGVPNVKERRLDYAVEVPGLLSFLSFGDFNAEIKGLEEFPEQDWPRTQAIFPIYRLMIICWVGMFLLSVIGCYLLWKKRLQFYPKLLWLFILSVLLPQIANQAGWVAAEMGRYPWIVYNLLRISEGLSKKVTAGQVLGSMIMFTVIYFFLFLVFLYMLDKKIKHGPVSNGQDLPYHLQEQRLENH